MARVRWAALAVAAGIGMGSGCSFFSGHPLFGRHREECLPEAPCCMEGGEGMPAEGPILGDYPPAAAPAPILGQPPAVQNTFPPLSTPPRLVPQPQQSVPAPYTPPR
jgi:hypothetical protein